MVKFAKKRALEDDSAGSDQDVPSKPAVKKSKGSKSLESGKDADGNSYWEIAPKRRVGISNFKNNTFINIREYYEADGQMKPGKKGISLSIEQYQALLQAIPAINAQLRNAGVAVEDPQPAGPPVEAKPKTEPQAKVARSKKSNIEATSDEDSE
ncbi:transcriptional Coactivator p15 family protein [Thozetella sp. PMI_491]|nr:transcriptional Coactivator p15 family protein [Thozetella sp. PMI_491]